jgi:hypothetical protein
VRVAYSLVLAILQDARGLADAVVKAIDKAESNFHKSLETSYNTMGDTTFKALRRVLPITRTKIDWTKIQNYKSGGDAGGKAAASRVRSIPPSR